MRSALFPGSILPQKPSIPTSFAGFIVAQKIASSSVMPQKSARFSTPRQSVSVLPASAPSSVSAMPSLTVTPELPVGESYHGRSDVKAVAYKLGIAVRTEGGEHRSALTVMERRHAVEKMGEAHAVAVGEPH